MVSISSCIQFNLKEVNMTAEQEQEIKEQNAIIHVPIIRTIKATKRPCPIDAKQVFLSKEHNCIKIKVEGEGPIYINIDELKEIIRSLENE
jgi:hypothetical protein